MPVTVKPIDTKYIKKKTIILTSFRDAKNYEGSNTYKYSISRWQPRNLGFPELKSLAPFYKDGRPIKSLPPNEYRKVYESEVLSNPSAKRQLQAIINLMNEGESSLLMCWCNMSRQEEYSELFCHRILVGWFIEENFSDIDVVYEDGAQNPVWDK